MQLVTSDAQLQQRLAAAQARIASLAQQCAAFWISHGPDREHGGFHGTLDRFGQPCEPTHKGLIQQARHLWALSIWHAHKQPRAEVRALADDLYAFITHKFYITKTGQYAYHVDARGNVLNAQHVLYAQAFAIYAFAEYGRVFGHERALQRALQLFQVIDAQAHDGEHGGYWQRRDASWLAPGCEKETNTHLHLLEAFSTLYAATEDARVGTRLEELVRLATHKILQPQGYAHQNFSRTWQTLGPASVSYGHDLEMYWLLDQAARDLGRPQDPAILDAARVLGVNAAQWGFDAKLGGYFYAGLVGEAPRNLEKVWWVQAEALPALFRLFEQTGDPVYLTRLEATLGYIERYQQNAAVGEWFWGVLPDGSVGPRGDAMGEEWKASYHSLRALVFCDAWLSTWLS